MSAMAKGIRNSKCMFAPALELMAGSGALQTGCVACVLNGDFNMDKGTMKPL